MLQRNFLPFAQRHRLDETVDSQTYDCVIIYMFNIYTHTYSYTYIHVQWAKDQWHQSGSKTGGRGSRSKIWESRVQKFVRWRNVAQDGGCRPPEFFL